jgi:cytochrome c oxidase subunit 2
MMNMLRPAGPDAALIAQMAWILFGGGTLIFVGVMILLARSLRGDGQPVRPLRWIVGAGMALPVFVLTALFVWSNWRSAQLGDQSSRQALQVAVTAKMWWWEVRYRDPVSGREIVSANEIHVPAGQNVYIALDSSDVLHSLWIPALNGKIDAIPGRITGLTLHAAQAGVYRGQCAEYCGEQHARMALHVVAHAAPDFAAWLARQARDAAPPASAQARLGRDAIVAQRCVACHTLRGVEGDTGARLGPDLTHIGSRLHIGAGTLRTHRGTLAGWIADPQAIKPGARMPASSELDGATLQAMALYLESLK